jgi:hypothetical protein
MLNSREHPSGKRPSSHTARYGGPAGTAKDSGGGAVALIEEQPAPNREDLSARPEWQLAVRIAGSRRLSKSDLLPKFLLFICEQSLTGNEREITEQRIGTQIFNRASDYNPGEDNIVRSYARMLRKRLDEYFEEEGRDEPTRLVVPRGGYVPAFRRNDEGQDRVSDRFSQDAAVKTELLVGSDTETGAPEYLKEPMAAHLQAWWQPAWISMLAGVVVGATLACAGWFGVRALQAQRAQTPAHALWAQLFEQNRDTLIVPADSGLGILQNLTGRLISLEEYANGSYLLDMKPPPGVALENVNDLRQQRYTSVANLKITVMLTQLPEFGRGHSQIRYARSITTEDLKSSNVILLGSPHTNPWVSLFDKELNFKLKYTPEVNRSFVLNEHPLSTEQREYQNGTEVTANRTYGAIDYLPSLDGTGHVLIIQGLNMAATQAAADTLLDPEAMKAVFKEATLPNGSLRPFELLIETSSIGATNPGARIIATRFYR